MSDNFDISYLACFAASFPAVVLLWYLTCAVIERRKRKGVFGYLAARWSMRYLDANDSLCKEITSGGYYYQIGHSSLASTALTGRQHGIPFSVCDYKFELGSSIGSDIVEKTVITAELTWQHPSILFLSNGSFKPLGRFAKYKELYTEQCIDRDKLPVDIGSSLKNYNIFAENPYDSISVFTDAFMLRFSKFKAVDIELSGNKLVVWSDKITSQHRLMQLTAQTIRLARAINKDH